MAKDRLTYIRLLAPLKRLIRNDHLVLAILALVAGAAAGGAVIAFREVISLVQATLYGSGSERLFGGEVPIPWWQILLAPAAGCVFGTKTVVQSRFEEQDSLSLLAVVMGDREQIERLGTVHGAVIKGKAHLHVRLIDTIK